MRLVLLLCALLLAAPALAGDFSTLTKGYRFHSFLAVASTNTWASSRSSCQAQTGSDGRALDLCPRALVCPDGPFNTPLGGMRSNDEWVPVLDGINDASNTWLSIGNFDPSVRLCRTHKCALGSNPSWGTQTSSHVYKGIVPCCETPVDFSWTLPSASQCYQNDFPDRSLFTTSVSADERSTTQFVVEVTYSDTQGITAGSVDVNDIVLLNPFSASSEVVYKPVSASYSAPRGVYTFNAPGGMWKLGDAGSWEVHMNPQQVRDDTSAVNQYVADGLIGTFTVTVNELFDGALDDGYAVHGEAFLADTSTYQNFVDHCAGISYNSQALTLCPQQVLCPDGPLATPRFGTYGADEWIPVGQDGSNRWVSLGNTLPGTRLCREYFCSNGVDSPWGTSTAAQAFRGRAFCCRQPAVATPVVPRCPATTSAYPTATLTSFSGIAGASTSTAIKASIEVVETVDTLDAASFSAADIRLFGPLEGTPNVLTPTGAPAVASGSAASGTVTLEYEFGPPGGAWSTAAHQGTYTVFLQQSQFADAAGGLTPLAVSLGDQTVTIPADGSAPVVSPVSIVSNNTDDTATAVNGDLITLTFSTDEDVGTPTVTIAGRAATVTGGPRDWTATIVSQGGDATGTVQFSITDVTDAASNTAAEVTATTDSSQVVRGCGDFSYGSTCSCEITPGNDLTAYPMDLILYTETDTPPAWTRLEDGKLHVVYDESIHYSTVAHVFNNTDDLCSQHWTWTSTVDEPSCTRTWEGEMIWANWEDCDIERSTSGDDIEFLVNFGTKVTEVIPGLRDGPDTRTVTHAMPFTLGFPTRVIANSSDIVAFSPVVEIGAIVEQTLKGTPGTDISMDVSFLTSVQWPFVLKSATWGAITADDNGAPDAFTLETTAGSCDDNNATEPNCQNTWSSTVYPASQTTTCELDGQYTVNWVVDCHDSVKASNDCPIDTATDDATLTFTIDTSSFCVQVADTVTLTANIYTYEDAAHTILKDDFLDGQTVYAEVPTSSDKVSIDSTRVVDATIVRDTEANIGLIADGDVVLPNDYAVARADGGSSAAGVSSKPSFQFTVNTASTHMDLADDSSETMTLAATVAVRYQNAGQAAFSKVRYETALQTKEKDVGASTSVGFGGTQSTTTTGTTSAASSEATIMGVNAMVVYGAGAIMALVLITAFVVLRRSDPTPTVNKSESQVQLTSTAGAGETNEERV